MRFTCCICNSVCNSAAQMDAHTNNRHVANGHYTAEFAAALVKSVVNAAPVRPAHIIHCPRPGCTTVVNSKEQLDMHLLKHSKNPWWRGKRPKREDEACWNFLEGRCDRGDACRYSHSPDAIVVPRRYEHEGTSKSLCWDFQRDGVCKRGDSCRYRHEGVGLDDIVAATTTVTMGTNAKINADGVVEHEW